MRLLFIDTETGGLDPLKHSLLEVALAVWEDGVVLDTLELRIAHDVYHVTETALEINGHDVARGPRVPEDEAVRLIDKLLFVHFGFEKPTLVGQNVQFDIGFMKQLYRPELYEKTFSHRVIDTASVLRFLKLAGVADLPGSGLDDAMSYFGVQVREDKRHTALGDVFALVGVFNGLRDLDVFKELREGRAADHEGREGLQLITKNNI